jgi:positive regulator of sigma E activity
VAELASVLEKAGLMKELGIITAINETSITVKKLSQDSCNACRIRHICGIQSQPEICLHHDSGGGSRGGNQYSIGETVEILVNPIARISSAFAFFIVPLFVLFLFYYLTYYILKLSELLSILISFVSLVLSVFLVKLYNGRFEKKYEIEIRKLS